MTAAEIKEAIISILSDVAPGEDLSELKENTLDGRFCLETLDEALSLGRPEISNGDQGCQFTATAFTERLESFDIAISMDGGGRALDNVFIERL